MTGWFIKVKIVDVKHSWKKQVNVLKKTITQEWFKNLVSHLDF